MQVIARANESENNLPQILVDFIDFYHTDHHDLSTIFGAHPDGSESIDL